MWGCWFIEVVVLLPILLGVGGMLFGVCGMLLMLLGVWGMLLMLLGV